MQPGKGNRTWLHLRYFTPALLNLFILGTDNFILNIFTDKTESALHLLKQVCMTMVCKCCIPESIEISVHVKLQHHVLTNSTVYVNNKPLVLRPIHRRYLASFLAMYVFPRAGKPTMAIHMRLLVTGGQWGAVGSQTQQYYTLYACIAHQP